MDMAKRRQKGESDDEVARLYSLPLDRFIAERDAVAKRLRSGGERAKADELRKLKKPNLPAWAINQGVRADRSAAQRLIAAGERLNAAQEAALSGAGPTELREAIADQQDAVEAMLGAIESSLESEPAPGVLDRVRETLRATAADDELRAQFAAGTLTREREAVGFGATPQSATVSRPAGRRSKATATAAERKRAEQAERRAARALEAAAKRVADAERRLKRAREALGAAEQRYDEAVGERDERDSELRQAEAELSRLSDG
jgi:hypothetical protein